MTGFQPFAGVLPPVVTPFDENLAPDRDAFAAHCRWLLDRGADGLAIFGTTSEANSLSADERMALLDLPDRGRHRRRRADAGDGGAAPCPTPCA